MQFWQNWGVSDSSRSLVFQVSRFHTWSGLHTSHIGPEHWNLFKNCFNINECMTGFVTIVGKGLEYSISHKKLYSFPCEFHHLWTKFRGLAHCASCNCNLPKYYLAGIKQLEIKEYRKDRRKICEARKPTTMYCVLLFYFQYKVSWCYILKITTILKEMRIVKLCS